MMRVVFAACLYLLAQHVLAGEVIKAQVEHKDKRYFVELDMRIKADPDRVHQLLTDYGRLGRLNSSIKSSEVVYSLNDRNHRVKVVTRACVMFFCKTIKQVQDVEQIGKNIVIATVVPKLSDFDYAHARWSIEPEQGMTRVTFSSDLKPSFWVPPLIGPPLIKNKLHDEAISTVETLERLAKQYDTAKVQ